MWDSLSYDTHFSGTDELLFQTKYLVDFPRHIFGLYKMWHSLLQYNNTCWSYVNPPKKCTVCGFQMFPNLSYLIDFHSNNIFLAVSFCYHFILEGQLLLADPLGIKGGFCFPHLLGDIWIVVFTKSEEILCLEISPRLHTADTLEKQGYAREFNPPF